MLVLGGYEDGASDFGVRIFRGRAGARLCKFYKLPLLGAVRSVANVMSGCFHRLDCSIKRCRLAAQGFKVWRFPALTYIYGDPPRSSCCKAGDKATQPQRPGMFLGAKHLVSSVLTVDGGHLALTKYTLQRLHPNNCSMVGGTRSFHWT